VQHHLHALEPLGQQIELARRIHVARGFAMNPPPRRKADQHPVRESPFAIRLSRLRLLQILAVYVLVVIAIVCLHALLLFVYASTSSRTLVESVRESMSISWDPGTAFTQPGRPIALYLYGIANALIAVLLPTLLLGSFVFKLFQHDPLQWRRSLTIEAHPSGHYVLAARFYNRLPVDAADLRVRAWLRWVPTDNKSVRRVKSLTILGRGQNAIEETDAFPLASPFEPTTVRVVLGQTERGDPIDGDGKIWVQGELVHREDASIVLVVDGATVTLSNPFRSTIEYSLDSAADIDMFQDIPLDSERGYEWSNLTGPSKYTCFSTAFSCDLKSWPELASRPLMSALLRFRTTWACGTSRATSSAGAAKMSQALKTSVNIRLASACKAVRRAPPLALP
jgi:hypothetical protein